MHKLVVNVQIGPNVYVGRSSSVISGKIFEHVVSDSRQFQIWRAMTGKSMSGLDRLSDFEKIYDTIR